MRSLLHIRKVCGLFIVLTLLCGIGRAQSSRVAFWNVENFFDTSNDTLTNDDDFTPQGANHWSSARFTLKRDNLYKVIVALGSPMVVGLAEVENDYVLDQLCAATPLRRQGYDFIHFDSPDTRGIDCALLYRKKQFHPFLSQPVSASDSATSYFTRDVLLAGGTTRQGDSLYLMVCHLPSKLGGDLADRHRARIARIIRGVVDTIVTAHPSATVVVMGDFNADPSEEAFRTAFGFEDSDTNPEGLTDLMYTLPEGEGTHNYAGRWSYLDHIMVRMPDSQKEKRLPQVHVYKEDFMLQPVPRSNTFRPFRTYSGPNYLGGFSDHLPVYIDLY